jgi:hypothetical protein
LFPAAFFSLGEAKETLWVRGGVCREGGQEKGCVRFLGLQASVY